MPIRHRRRFDPARVRRILNLLGMSNMDLLRLLNRQTGGAARAQDVSSWLTGRRALPDAAVVLLKALVRERQVTKGPRGRNAEKAARYPALAVGETQRSRGEALNQRP